MNQSEVTIYFITIARGGRFILGHYRIYIYIYIRRRNTLIIDLWCAMIYIEGHTSAVGEGQAAVNSVFWLPKETCNYIRGWKMQCKSQTY